jgi:hypothetical protein
MKPKVQCGKPSNVFVALSVIFAFGVASVVVSRVLASLQCFHDLVDELSTRFHISEAAVLTQDAICLLTFSLLCFVAVLLVRRRGPLDAGSSPTVDCPEQGGRQSEPGAESE